MFVKVLARGQRTWIASFVCFLVVFGLIHLYLGVDLSSFLVSNALFTLTYITVVPFYYFISGYTHMGRIFKEILVVNAILVIIALPFLFMARPYQEWFWYINQLTKGVVNFPRLALFTYEASYYSLLFIPVAFYYLLKFFSGDIRNNKWMTVLMVFVPLLLSLSFGVLGATFITALIMCLIFVRRLFLFRRAFIVTVSLICILLLTFVALYIYYPKNILFIRLGNIWTGKDTSANGRVIESFTLAWRIAESRSIYFGVGLGQIKIVAVELVRKYYAYWGNIPRIDIPNAMGETLAIFGITGVVLRIFLEVWLFFKTSVYTNYYRLSLFIFIFIYQFTGSFITNIAEYVVWIIAFSGAFRQFEIPRRIKIR
jgi:hypothetical protein